MATLTYDSTDPEAPELSPEEQDSLARGEAQAAEEQGLLAGKYKDAEALEQAYIELQQKLGDQKNDEDGSKSEETEEVREQDPSSEEVDTESDEGDEDIETSFLSDEEVASIQNIAGGPEEYENMLKWAAVNLDKSDQEAFDHVIGLNDAKAASFAVSVLNNVYRQSQDKEGDLITGTRTAETVDVFKSQAQVVEAMSDPKYDRDPAYRQAVMQKLERSNIQY